MLAYTRIFLCLSRMFSHREKQVWATAAICLDGIVFVVNIIFRSTMKETDSSRIVL